MDSFQQHAYNTTITDTFAILNKYINDDRKEIRELKALLSKTQLQLDILQKNVDDLLDIRDQNNIKKDVKELQQDQ
jgi:hypothetical protein